LHPVEQHLATRVRRRSQGIGGDLIDHHRDLIVGGNDVIQRGLVAGQMSDGQTSTQPGLDGAKRRDQRDRRSVHHGRERVRVDPAIGLVVNPRRAQQQLQG
jgi:hypothetical protein